jgi:uncharacterized protein YndB with AHSA1/START domain
MEFVRSRRIAAAPQRIWPWVDDIARWHEWFTEAERGEVLSGVGLGRRQRMYGHARGKATEIDSVVTAYEPPHLMRWHHEAERVDGRPARVVFASDAVAEFIIKPDGDGSRVTYRLIAEAGNPIYWLVLRLLANGPIQASFEASLMRLAALAEAPEGAPDEAAPGS